MRTRISAAILAIVLAGPIGIAQTGAQTGPSPAYIKPPQAIVDVLDAEPLPGVSLSPTRDVMVLLPRRSMPSITDLARPWLGLAGVRINPATNGPRLAPSGTGITLRAMSNGTERRIAVPPDAHIGFLGFSPDGKRFAFTNTTASRIDLFIADVASGRGIL